MSFDQRERGYGPSAAETHPQEQLARDARDGGLMKGRRETVDELLLGEASRLERRAAGLRALAGVIPREGLTGAAQEALYQAVLPLVQR